MISEDLQYLQREAFNFSLEVNPHAPGHSTIREELMVNTMVPDKDDEWVSREQREEAYRTGRYVEGRLYPNGSVSFFVIRGTRTEDVVQVMVHILRQEKRPVKEVSRAFDPCEIPK